MKRHSCPLPDKEQDKSVIFASFDRDSVELRLKMIGIIVALNSKLFERHLIHHLHQLLAAGLVISVVQEVNTVSRELRLDTHLFHSFNQRLHSVLVVVL